MQFYYLYCCNYPSFGAYLSLLAGMYTMNSATLINKYQISEVCQLEYILRSCIAASYSGYIWSGHKIFHVFVITKYGYACHSDWEEVRGQVWVLGVRVRSLDFLSKCLHPLSCPSHQSYLDYFEPPPH